MARPRPTLCAATWPRPRRSWRRASIATTRTRRRATMEPTRTAVSFQSPFAVEAPPGAEDWRRLYPYYYLFSEPRREFEEGKFWFFDGMHNPEPVFPFDTIMTESWWVALNMFGTRVYIIPPALGIDQRIVNGYLYISPNSITDREL